MELHSLGGYRLLEPVPTLSSINRLFLARRDDAPEDAPATTLAKVLLPGSGDQFAMLKAQFAHEANLLRSFSHPGIPSLRAAGTQNGVDFFVMDYVAGVDLAVLLGHEQNEPRGLSKELAVYILGQLADALRYVHGFEVPTDDGVAPAEHEIDGEGERPPADAGGADEADGADDADEPDDDDEASVDGDGFEYLDVLHRDLCPANVFLSLDGDVVLGDFGSASSKWLAPELTGNHAGHIAYKAPERVTGSGKATVKSDLFSLAVILWEMLRGERCFKAASELETMDEIVRFDISHSSRRVTGLSSKLSEVLRRNLDRDPERRYPDAYKVLQRLSQSPEAGGAERARQELARLVAEAVRDRRRSKPDRR
jgi:serine/threonine-protein kinase